MWTKYDKLLSTIFLAKYLHIHEGKKQNENTMFWVTIGIFQQEKFTVCSRVSASIATVHTVVTLWTVHASSSYRMAVLPGVRSFTACMLC